MKPFGLRVPPGGRAKFAERVTEVCAKQPTLSKAIEPLLHSMREIVAQINEIDRTLLSKAKSHDDCRRLMTVPGVGPITALAFVSAIGNGEQFPRPRSVGAFFGLTPRRYQSGDVDYQGRICKRGDNMVRTLFYEAANLLLTVARKPVKKHPYYSCHKKGCVSYRKSIRRAQIEGDFAAMLEAMTPSGELVTFARGMFRDIWDQLSRQSEAIRASLTKEIDGLNRKMEKLMTIIEETDDISGLSAFQKRIGKIESDKVLLIEKQANIGKPRHTFEEVFELAMNFLSNPHKLWASGEITYRQTVLKLAFAEAPAYTPRKRVFEPRKSVTIQTVRRFLRNRVPNGGQRGIRTLETVARLHAFQACAFDHSATCPKCCAPLRSEVKIRGQWATRLSRACMGKQAAFDPSAAFQLHNPRFLLSF